MSVEEMAGRVRRMAHCQGHWAACRWAKNQGFHPHWVALALAGKI